MKKLILLAILIISLMAVACSNDKAVEAGGSELASASENSGIVAEKTGEMEDAAQQEAETAVEDSNIEDEAEAAVENDSEEEADTDSPGENDWEAAVFAENIYIDPILSVNDEKLAVAIEKGFESPASQIDLYHYTPKNTDVIKYDPQNSPLEMVENLTHKGFEGLEVVYEKTSYDWDDFFDDLDFTEYERNITVSLKGESIFEADVEDEYQKFYRYFDENKGLYYEVNDVMLGNYLDEDAELTNKRIGNCCNYNGIDGLAAPSYNPLMLQNGEEARSYYITVLDDKACLYVESLYNERFYKKWIDIELGVLVKELVFDNEGLMVEKKVARSITEKDIDEGIFKEPKDVDFRDITLFIFSLEGGDVETIVNAFDNTIPTSETGVLLTSDTGSKVTIYTTGIDDMSLGDPIYYSQITLDSGEVRTIRRINDGRFHTICDELEKVEIFDRSCYDKKFFDFEDVGLVSYSKTEDAVSYIFYDPNNISVSALYDVYEYVIKDGEFTEIKYYQIENIAVNEPIGDVITYKISFIDFDENVYDESCMDDYEIIDRGENSFDDGEYMPFYYQ